MSEGPIEQPGQAGADDGEFHDEGSGPDPDAEQDEGGEG